MAGSVIPKEVKKEGIDSYISEAWKVCLLTNAFVYASGTHVLYTDLTNEVVGTGYTAGGEVVSQSAWGAGSGYVDTTNAMLDAADVQWTGASFTARYAVVYSTATIKRIRAIYDFGGDKTVTGGTFTIQWSNSGLIKVSSTP